MKPIPQDTEMLTRWLDGELDTSGRENYEAGWSADERARHLAEKVRAEELADLMREVYPDARDVAGPEFFMHQLARRLDRAEAPTGEKQPARRLPLAGWLAAAAALVLALILVNRLVPSNGPAGGAITASKPSPVLLASYVPDASVHVAASYNPDADAVIIILDGLKPIATTEDLLGFQRDDPRSGSVRLAGQPRQHRYRGGSKDS